MKSNPWRPEHIFEDGTLYADEIPLTPDEAEQLAEYLQEWADHQRADEIESVPESEWPAGIERGAVVRTTIAGQSDRFGIVQDVTRRKGSDGFALVIDAVTGSKA